MKTKDNRRLLQKKRRNQANVLLAMIVIVLCLYFHQYWVLVVALIIFNLNDLLKADHIFYSPKENYQYNLSPDQCFSIFLTKSGHLERAQLKEVNISDETLTVMMPVMLSSLFSGKIYDPYVEIVCGAYRNRQYFERGCSGRRYLNLTAAIADDIAKICDVKLSFHHCSATSQASKVMFFLQPDFTKKRMLVIAPHADDAEIAAFGLYSQADTHIITLTAGEIQAEPFQHVYSDIEAASKLKGRLRAWDSVSIPLWGGVPRECCMNLGYFCMTLKTMHDAPEVSVRSLQANISDTRVFREFNQKKIESDAHGQATWKALLDDLKELISEIKPDVIVMNDKQLDVHEDHIYAHIAVKQALADIEPKPEYLLYYTNHYKNTDMHPFGIEHAIASLAPHFEGEAASSKIYSLTLSEEQQKNKVYALEMMHDLKTKKRWKKKRREWLQSIFIRRPINRYGEDEYFRKAIKENELFFMEKL